MWRRGSSWVALIATMVWVHACTNVLEDADLPVQSQADDLSADLTQHKQSRSALRALTSQTTDTPAEKIGYAMDLLSSAGASRKIAVSSSATKNDRDWASRALKEDEELAGKLFAEAGSDYILQGDLQKARQAYWLILRAFPSVNFPGDLKQRAESQLRSVDEMIKRESQVGPR